jgi:hypothetical protein
VSHGSGSHGSGDRLKPPPDTINFEHRKIKLISSSSRSNDLESIQIKRLKKFEKSDTNGDILDRIIIKDRRKEKEKEEKSETQSIKQKPADKSNTDIPADHPSSQGRESCSSEKESGSRKIKLKRSHSTSSPKVKYIAVVVCTFLCNTCNANRLLGHAKNKQPENTHNPELCFDTSSKWRGYKTSVISK